MSTDEPKTHAGAVLAAAHAVKERPRKANERVELGEVVRAESQQAWTAAGSPGATSWRLGLRVISHGDKASFVEAIVSVDPSSNDTLKSWNEVRRGDG